MKLTKNTRFVLVRLKGGLGNQLFQYATAFSIAQRRDCQVWADISGFSVENLRPDETPRAFELSRLIDPDRIVTSPALFDDLWKTCNSPLARARRFLRLYTPACCVTDTSIRAAGDVALASRYCLEGYFQSERFFKSVETRLRAMIFASVKPGRSSIVGMDDSVPVVAVHVRLGDYVTNPLANAFHGVCSREYYGKAMDFFRTNLGNPRFVIFSDDSEKAPQLIAPRPDVTFMDSSSGADAWTDLILMSTANHHVIANSSYSWWAAWLGKKEGQTVVAPARWFSRQDTPPDLLPSDWLKL